MKSETQKHTTDRCSFRSEAKGISLVYGQRTHYFKRSTGMRYLLELLANPGLPISIEQLYQEGVQPAPAYRQFSDASLQQSQDMDVQHWFTPIPLTDLKAVTEIKAELNAIIAELAVLDENCDLARADELRTQQEGLMLYLRQVYRPTGQIRNFSDEHYRHKKSVKRALNRALEQIALVEPALAVQLKACIKLQGVLLFHPHKLDIAVYGY